MCRNPARFAGPAQHTARTCRAFDLNFGIAMVNITDPVTHAAFAVLVSVVAGTFLLIVVAIFRRWMQIRFSRHVHALRREYRPVVARALCGAHSIAEVEKLSELSLPDLELLLDPVFSKRKLPERCLDALRNLCADLRLIKLWESRVARGSIADTSQSESGEGGPDPAVLRHLERAKSIRNLGALRHRASWPLLVKALDDRHLDIQLVALRSLAAINAEESFPVLGERLQAVILGTVQFPPLQGLRAAMVSFELSCASSLMPLLLHPHRIVRHYAADILRTMVYHQAARRPDFGLTSEIITPGMVELLLTKLPKDASSDVRARTAEVIVFLNNSRTDSVLRELLKDRQWFVRMRAVRALARRGHALAPLHAGICECLRDPHWRVREAAIHTLLSFGPEGTGEVFRQFMQSPDGAAREQILEIVERAGLAGALADAYEVDGGSDGMASAEPSKAGGTGRAVAQVSPGGGAATHAEFLHRVDSGLEPGNQASNARGQKSKGASQPPLEDDGRHSPSL